MLWIAGAKINPPKAGKKIFSIVYSKLNFEFWDFNVLLICKSKKYEIYNIYLSY